MPNSNTPTRQTARATPLVTSQCFNGARHLNFEAQSDLLFPIGGSKPFAVAGSIDHKITVKHSLHSRHIGKGPSKACLGYCLVFGLLISKALNTA
jgi:hypothetical protein